MFGSRHDYALFKMEFPPDVDWFQAFRLWVDLGYLGIQKEYAALEIHIPHCRMKRFNSLTAPFRNHKDNLVDDVALVTAGLANWMLSVHNASPA